MGKNGNGNHFYEDQNSSLSESERLQWRTCLRHVASCRWLNVHELIDILNRYQVYDLPLIEKHTERPQNGSIFLCAKESLSNLKHDNINWVKRVNSNKVREDHVNLKLNKEVVIRAYHAHALDPSTFHRRRYHLSKLGAAVSLIHYQDVAEAEKNWSKSIYSSFLAQPLTHIDWRSRRCIPEEKKEYQNLLPKQKYGIHSMFEPTPLAPPQLISDQNQCHDLDKEIDHSLSQILDAMATDEHVFLSGMEELTHSYVPEILDLSPEWCWEVGGTKVLICLQSPLLQQVNVEVGFGDQFVPAQIISSTALRCIAPRFLSSAPAFISISLRHNGIQTQFSQTYFEYRVSPPTRNISLFHKRKKLGDDFSTLDEISSLNEISEMNSEKCHRGEDAPLGLGGTDMFLNEYPLWNRRKSKMRVVERLVHAHNRCSFIGSSNGNSSANITGGSQKNDMEQHFVNEEDWPEIDCVLEDSALGELEDDKLEELLDKLVIRVMGQMVQLAVTDTSIEEELSAVDPSGYSLLHYACLYGLSKLVPVLLQRGALTDARTKCGKSHTPLHLAAAAGHLDIVNQLLQAGACPTCRDEDNLTPHQLAHHMGNSSIVQLLKSRKYNWKSCQLCQVSSKIPDPRPAFSPKWGPARSPSGGGGGSTTELLHTAFSSLSLLEKCAVSLSLKNSMEEVHEMENENGGEISGVMSATDKGRLDVAMSMMGHEELEELEGQARIIQGNLRAWALRRNYESMRSAAITLQIAWKERQQLRHVAGNIHSSSQINPQALNGAATHFGTELSTTSELAQQISASTALQAAARGMLVRRNISTIKRKATALLALRQNRTVREWIGRRQSSSAGNVMQWQV